MKSLSALISIIKTYSKKYIKIIILTIFFVFFFAVFYSVFSRSKITAILVLNKNELTQDHIVFQQISASSNSLLRLDPTAADFSQQKTELIQNLDEVVSNNERAQQQLIVHRSIFIKDPKIIVELDKEKTQIQEMRKNYFDSAKDFNEQIKGFDAIVSRLYDYDPAVDFSNGINTNNAGTQLERANLASESIEKIKNELLSMNVTTERIRSTIEVLEGLENRFGEAAKLIDEQNFEAAQQAISQIANDYSDVKISIYTGMISLYTTDHNLQFITNQNNIIEKYEYYIDSINRQQNLL